MDIREYLTKDYIQNIVSQGKRVDDRGFNDRRKLEIEQGYVGEKACGSAYVRLGDTQVLVGISMDLGEPYSDRPDSGVMTTSAEFRPMASPLFESGPPRENAVECARVVDRGIRESGMIDLKALKVDEDKVWIVFIDIHMLDDHGNLIDASGLAGTAALHNCRMPKVEDGRVIYGEWDGKLPLTCTPIPTTVGKINNELLVDPNMEEEYAMESRLTVTTTKDGLTAMQKGGEGTLTVDETKKTVDIALKEWSKLHSQVEG